MRKRIVNKRQPRTSVVDLDLLVQLPKIIRRIVVLEERVSFLKTELVSRSSVADLVSVDEAVKISGKSREALYKLIQRKVLPVVRKSRSLFLRRRDVTSLARERDAKKEE